MLGYPPLPCWQLVPAGNRQANHCDPVETEAQGSRKPPRDILDQALQVPFDTSCLSFQNTLAEKGPEVLSLLCTSAAWVGALACWLGASWRTVRIMTLPFLFGGGGDDLQEKQIRWRHYRVFCACLPYKGKF